MSRFLIIFGVILRDALGLAGAAAVAYGVWQIYPPAGWIAAGLETMAGVWLHARGGVS